MTELDEVLNLMKIHFAKKHDAIMADLKTNIDDPDFIFKVGQAKAYHDCVIALDYVLLPLKA